MVWMRNALDARRAAPWRAALLLPALLLLSLLTALPPSGAQGIGAPTVVGQHVRGEAPDYATEAFADPWDYAEATDVQVDPGPVINIDRIAAVDGVLELDFPSTGHFHAVWPGFPGGLRLGRDGPVHPVDASRYTHLSMRVRSPVQTYGAVIWQTCADLTAGCDGQGEFLLQGTGWQTVTVDLTQGTGQPWAGDIQGLRVTVGLSGPERLEIDWMRVHGAVEPAVVTWTNPGLAPAELLWDADANPANNTADNPGWGVVEIVEGVTGTSRFDVAAYPPGSYRFSLRNGGVTTPTSAPLEIEAAPRVRLLNPDITGGEDFATAVLGNPWDFSGPEDVVETGNALDLSFADGRLYGTNGGENPRDPYVVLSGLGDLDADRYHRFTVTAGYDGGFSLGFEPGGGAHGRISWRQDGGYLWQQTAEVVTYTDIDTYTVPLGVQPGDAVMEPDLGPQPGWATGTTTSELRWDPNEDIGPRRWWVDEIRLAADDESFGTFDVEWADDAHPAGTSISLFADTDAEGFDGTPVATDLTTVGGVNSFTLDTSGLPAGRYWLHVEATSPSGVATSRTYATGPLQVHSSAASSPEDLRVAGADRVATAIELSRTAFPGPVHTAIIARADDFPDALAATPLAASIGAPVLLNPRSSLSPAVRAELERLAVQRVIILGGTAAQAATVEEELRSFVGIVDRAAGVDRFHTAGIVAERAAQEWAIRGQQAGPPLLALGSRFEDALAAASLAGHHRRPLLLTSAESVPSRTADSLIALGARSATVVGGAGIVTPGLLQDLRTRVGTVDHFTGADHVETAALAADAAVDAGARRDIVVVASGDAFPDALAAGPAAIAQGGVLLLTPRDVLGQPTAAYLAGGTTRLLQVAGGPAAVSTGVVAELAEVAGL